MTDIRRVSPEEAQALLDEGYVYVDVRSEPEFEEGHVPGALNVPISRAGPGGMQQNPEFLGVMRSAFEPGERIVVGCRSGARSSRAAKLLVDAGFTSIADMTTGWEGKRDAFGRPEAGWSRKGLPVETGAPQGQAYADVKKRRAR